MSKANNPAFPFAIQNSESEIHYMGLTKLEYFAAIALQGIIAAREQPATIQEIDEDANCAVSYAIALIRALEKAK